MRGAGHGPAWWRLLSGSVAVVALTGCGGRAVPPELPEGPRPPSEGDDVRVDDGPPIAWRLHAFDVGTGLAVLVHGPDFALLYDGGSNDDRRVGADNRLLAYLRATLGASGGAACRHGDRSKDGGADPERELPLHHVFLSHPHLDHLSLLPDVVRCYAVHDFWDPGFRSESAAYRGLLAAIGAERGLRYHTARPMAPAASARERRGSVAGDERGALRASERTGEDDEMLARGGGLGAGDAEGAALTSWQPFSEGDRIALGDRAWATVLSARWDAEDPNDASIVMRLDLGRASVLFTGDATAGKRTDPSAPPRPGSVEDHLLRRHRAALDVDVLQVAHHGSSTSSRRAFLRAVSPRWAIVSAGPMRYGEVVLPDAEVLDELGRAGARVLRTDEDDEGCRARERKVGSDVDGKPGGCSAVTLRLESSGAIAQEDGPAAEP